MFLRFLLLPISWLYGLVMIIRNKFFDWNIFKQSKFEIPVISVGNLAVGGTGKTPHVKWLTSKFEQFQTAIILRGYGRKSKGFRLVQTHSQIDEVGDEALEYKHSFSKNTHVAVSENRSQGLMELLNLDSSINLVFLDDAYQHRSITRNFNILLTDYNKPYFKDYVIPTGRLREFRNGKKRADAFIVTKCPPNIDSIQKNQIIQAINPNPKQKIFFSTIKYGPIVNLITSENNSLNEVDFVLLVTGIASPKPLVEHVATHCQLEHLVFSDHHPYSINDLHRIHQIFDKFASPNKIILTTEKDKMRLFGKFADKLTDYPWYFQSMTVELGNEIELISFIEQKI